MPNILVFGDDNVEILKKYLYGPTFYLESHAGLTSDRVVRELWELEALIREDGIIYDRVVLILGGNDLLLQNVTCENLRKIYEMVIKHVPKCVFVHIHPMPGLALPNILANVNQHQHFEGLYLNDSGARVVSANIRWNLGLIQ